MIRILFLTAFLSFSAYALPIHIEAKPGYSLNLVNEMTIHGTIDATPLVWSNGNFAVIQKGDSRKILFFDAKGTLLNEIRFDRNLVWFRITKMEDGVEIDATNENRKIRRVYYYSSEGKLAVALSKNQKQDQIGTLIQFDDGVNAEILFQTQNGKSIHSLYLNGKKLMTAPQGELFWALQKLGDDHFFLTTSSEKEARLVVFDQEGKQKGEFVTDDMFIRALTLCLEKTETFIAVSSAHNSFWILDQDANEVVRLSVRQDQKSDFDTHVRFTLWGTLPNGKLVLTSTESDTNSDFGTEKDDQLVTLYLLEFSKTK
ncbi:MAG: hypothetical protein AB7F43_09940 [Bacteriovoracia bacterium]